mgnify:CR=1 FL=1
MVNRDQELGFVDSEILGQKVPRIGDRLFLEIIAKAEIAQHLEKRVMPRGIAHIVQIVMLATRAHTFLAGSGADIIAMLHPGKTVLEDHHAGIGEHQRRIVARHKRRTVDNTVIVALEEAQKGGTDFIQRGHGHLFPGRVWACVPLI